MIQNDLDEQEDHVEKCVGQLQGRSSKGEDMTSSQK